jgi:hypothetical protein
MLNSIIHSIDREINSLKNMFYNNLSRNFSTPNFPLVIYTHIVRRKISKSFIIWNKVIIENNFKTKIVLTLL